MATPPTVLHPLSIRTLLQYILATQSDPALTTLIICSSRDAFLQDLVDAFQASDDGEARDQIAQLAAPTLHNLFTARHVKVAFCPSAQALLAYLMAWDGYTLEKDELGGGQEAGPRMVLVNPLRLHAATSSFSAQGLSRTFAAAVETSIRLRAALTMIECQVEKTPTTEADDMDTDGDHEDEPDTGPSDPWEQEVSILNVSAKKFGGDRAWAGRTVKVKRIASRWFRFERLVNMDL